MNKPLLVLINEPTHPRYGHIGLVFKRDINEGGCTISVCYLDGETESFYEGHGVLKSTAGEDAMVEENTDDFGQAVVELYRIKGLPRNDAK